MRIVIATVKSWNIENALVFAEKYPEYNVHPPITSKGNLTYEIINKINPDWIFFPHWSWIIPKEIYENFKCVVFHMTDLPFGRGGSPLQNLISKNVYNTRISAIEVVEMIDAGRVYWKSPELYIGYGSAENILKQVSQEIFNLGIPYILENNPIPEPQWGRVVHFDRLHDNELKRMPRKGDYYDFIRMHDGEGYDRAFINHSNIFHNIKIEFFDAELVDGKVRGRFEIE